MDVSMPRLTGFEACRRLKADERTHLVPIVLVTGLVAREDRIQGIAAGCDDFLTKPVDSEQLMARTRNLLRTKSLVDELEQELEHDDGVLLAHLAENALTVAATLRRNSFHNPPRFPAALRARLSEQALQSSWNVAAGPSCFASANIS